MESLTGLSVPALAYLGDSVLELLVRETLVREGLSRSESLNREALGYVRATAQSAAVDRLLPHLSEEEAAWYRRGRNSGHIRIPKSASAAEYRRATGMEVLFGYLYMTKQETRARTLFAIAYTVDESDPAQKEEETKQ